MIRFCLLFLLGRVVSYGIGDLRFGNGSNGLLPFCLHLIAHHVFDKMHIGPPNVLCG
jgi:hypothetical protein